jgi:Putative zinc-finger
MDNLFHNSSGVHNEHPSREMLLLMVDGELQAREAAQIDAHLEACWPCRVKTQKIQNAIADIIEFDEHVLSSRLIPPQGWRHFDQKLNHLVATSGKQSFSSRFFGSLGRFLPLSHRAAIPRWSPALVRGVVAIVLVVAIVALVPRLTREPTVSANQLLANSIQAEELQTRSTSDPVVHQRLRITRKDQSAGRVVTLDLWRDAKNARVRQFIADANQMVPITTADQKQMSASDLDVIIDLQSVLRANHMDVSLPLSATTYKAWHDALHGQHDDISRSKDNFGTDVLSLHTRLPEPVNAGQISDATLVVRAVDWLPTELRFTGLTNAGLCVYELTQTASEVVSLAQVDPAIFSDQPIPVSLSKNETAKKEPEPAPTALAVNSQPLAPNIASPDLEVETLRLLHEAGADLGEQITVQRHASGQLELSGVVETEQRKREIINALAPLAGNSAVRIDIQTVAEALAQQQQQRARSRATPAPVTQQNIEINSDAVAAAPELRSHFSSDEQMREFAARMVRQSRSTLSHVYALKRLMSQFSPESLRALTPEAKSKWLELVRAHARAYQTELAALKRELQLIFGSRPGAGDSNVSGINDDVSLRRAVEELFADASATDTAIHSAFVASTGPVSSSINSPQFWQQMGRAGAIAARISQAK